MVKIFLQDRVQDEASLGQPTFSWAAFEKKNSWKKIAQGLLNYLKT